MYINLTSDTLRIRIEDSDEQHSLSSDIVHKQAGEPALVMHHITRVYTGDEFPIIQSGFAKISGLPEPEAGVNYIVSSEVAHWAATQKRRDVYTPTITNCIKNAHGKLFAVRGLTQFI